MARYNSALASTTITGTYTISSPSQGAFTNLAGTAPYTVTLPIPALFPGSNQTFYNATGGTVTLSTPSGILTGTGGSNASTVPCFAGNVLSVTSDGTNYVVISEDGSALTATTGSFTGDVTINGAGATVSLTPQTVTITPSSTSNINNMNIGASTRGSGAFTSLAANAAVSFTANTASSTTGTGTLVVTGGVGVSGQVTATSVSATNLTGTVQTAAQPNITSTGSLAVPSLVVNGSVSRQILTASTTSALMDANTTNNMLTLNAPYSSAPASNTNGGSQTSAKWGIHFVGKTETNDLDSLSKSASIYAISEDTFGYNRQVGLSFFTSAYDANQAERVRITNTGSVGIATSTPASKLTVKATDGATGGIRLAHSTDNGPVVNIFQNGSDGYIDLYTGENPTTLRTHIASYGDSYFAPAASGRLGVGTSTPQYKLDVNNNTNGSGFQASFGSTYGSGLWSGIHFGYSESGNTAYRKSAIVFERTDLTSGNAQGKVHILNGPQSGGSSATIADAKISIAENGDVGISQRNPSYRLDVSGTLRSSYSFRNYQISHSTTNTSGVGQTTTNITQIADMSYEYSYYIDASTGGYPTCPYSYHIYCPIQKQNSGSWGMATVEIWGMHRGMWGTSYSEYQKWAVGSGSDGGGMILLHNQNGASNDGSQRVRMGYMDYNGTFVENGGFGTTGVGQGSYTGNSIGNGYYKMPFFFKIYTNCGADKEYMIKVTTSDPGVLGPPYKGATRLSPNTAPTSTMYW